MQALTPVAVSASMAKPAMSARRIDPEAIDRSVSVAYLEWFNESTARSHPVML